ncbi:MAG: hypothetical protein L3K19_04600 [Thermoplasmata archaeon]|nr:hypothetical protein [Thermoplasmata archaeon]
MGLIFDWGNLSQVALPCFVSLTVGAFLALFMRRAADHSRLPRTRERCVRCRFEEGLIERGTCEQSCAVNAMPTLPLVLFVAVTSVAALAFLYPDVVVTYLLPFGSPLPAYPDILLTLVLVTNLAAAVALAAYFVQDLPYHRDLFNFGAAAAALVGLFVGTTASGVVRIDGQILVPVALGALLFGLAAEARARQGRPAFGLRALGVATAPLFLLTVLALGRIVEIVRIAASAH